MPMNPARILGFLLCPLALGLGALQARGQRTTVLPPLHTEATRILDSKGRAVRLTSVNWYGFDQKEFVVGGLDRAPLEAIIGQIRQIGVNPVRLPWANETLEHDPGVPDYAVAANPQFKGKHAMAIMDAVIAALARAHIMVILDNHMSRADWCCSEPTATGSGTTANTPRRNGLQTGRQSRAVTEKQPWVIGADLRNELRGGAAWAGLDPKLDWHAAAERGGRAVLVGKPKAAHHG